jgi:putative heme-binding domain-containing protein
MMPFWLQRVAFAVGILIVGCAVFAAEKANVPRLLSVGPLGPFEVRATFDRPIGAEVARQIVGKSIAYRSSKETQGSLRIAAAKLDDGGKTLVLTTDPHPRAASYRIDLPIGGATIPVVYDLSGVEATWDDGTDGAMPAWTGRWASLSPASAGVGPLIAKKGRFALATLLTLPTGSWTIRITATAPLEATLGGEEPSSKESGQAVFRVESTGEPILLTLNLRTGGPSDKPLSARLVMQKADGAESDVPPERFLLPWAPPEPPPAAPLENVPDLKGGDPIKGRAVFYGPEAKCSSCHKVRGEGGEVGPDLSALVGRDRTEVYRDVFAPSARINPDYVSYTLALKDGRILVGTVRADGADKLRVTDTEAKPTVVPRDEVESFRPSATSIMPVGLTGALGDARLRDLIAFLTTPPVAH